MQEDILLDCMTPRESLTFAARLKLKNNTKEKIQKRVENLIIQVIYNYKNSLDWKNVQIHL